jgi:hypothetical protein
MRDLTPARRGTTAPDAAPLPMSLPLSYISRDGRHCLAYARSPWAPQRYLVIQMRTRPDVAVTDLECVHDDFGQLVPVRQRVVLDDGQPAALATWTRVTAGGES